MAYLMQLGHGGALDPTRIVAIARAKSAPVKRLLEAAGPGQVINLTYGYPRQSVVLLDNGYLAVISLTIEELLAKLYPDESMF